MYSCATNPSNYTLHRKIVSLVLWMISLFIMVVAATASQAPSYVAVLILLVLLLFAILIAVINIVFNRGT